MAADIGDVSDTSFDPGDALMIERSPFPAIGNRVRIGSNLRRTKSAEMLTLSVEHSHVRAEKLVCGTGEEVAVDGSDIDEPVRAIVDSVDVAESADRVSKFGDRPHRVDRSDRVGGESDGDELCVLVDLGSKVQKIQRAVFVMNLGPTNRNPAIVRHSEPWRDVGIVVEAGDQDLVTGLEFAADRP
jgi:hypothetical protein